MTDPNGAVMPTTPNPQVDEGEGQDMFARQAALNLVLPRRVAVVGCGGVGSWTALALAEAGVPHIILFDGDRIERHNLNRIPVPPSAIGARKSQALKAEILRLRPGCLVDAYGMFDPKVVDEDVFTLLGENPQWVVVTTDTLKSRRMVRDWTMSNVCVTNDGDTADVRYLEVAAEGEFGSVAGSPAEWSTELEEQPGYATVPVWAGSSMMAGLLAAYYVVHNVHPGERQVRIGWDPQVGLKVVDFDPENRPAVMMDAQTTPWPEEPEVELADLDEDDPPMDEEEELIDEATPPDDDLEDEEDEEIEDDDEPRDP